MKKVSVPPSNSFCPQSLFLFGTYKEDGTPNFGLFCWLSYCWDGEFKVMACIGGEKLTKDRINESGIFSACLVTEDMLPLADYLGNHDGYSPDKMNIRINTYRGKELNVPILEDSPWCYELAVTKTVELDGSVIYICKVINIQADERLTDQLVSVEERIKAIAPASTTCQTYFSWDGKVMGEWGTMQVTE